MTRHQKVLAARGNNKKNVKVTMSKYKYNKLNSSEGQMNSIASARVFIVVVIKTC